MLVIVLKNGREHRIKGCKSYSMPTNYSYGEIKMENGQSGVIYNKDEISFCYFTKDDLELSNNQDLEVYKKALKLACEELSKVEVFDKEFMECESFYEYFKTKAKENLKYDNN